MPEAGIQNTETEETEETVKIGEIEDIPKMSSRCPTDVCKTPPRCPQNVIERIIEKSLKEISNIEA